MEESLGHILNSAYQHVEAMQLSDMSAQARGAVGSAIRLPGLSFGSARDCVFEHTSLYFASTCAAIISRFGTLGGLK